MKRLLNRWEEVEGNIKSAELVHRSVPIPAINELRYAARQLIWAITSASCSNNADGSLIDKALSNAEQYITNTDHAVVESVVLYISWHIDELNYRFGQVAISEQAPYYEKLCGIRNDCVRLIEESRRNPSQRDQNYQQIKDKYISELIQHSKNIIETDVIMSLNKRQSAIEKYKLKQNIILWQSMFFFASFIVALLAGALMYIYQH
jgi:hypothetical protein